MKVKFQEQGYQTQLINSIANDFFEASMANTDMAWSKIKSTILTAAEHVVGKKEQIAKITSMNQKIINLIEENRNSKNTKSQKYMQL